MKVIETIEYIFPRGNYLYYVAYLSAIIVFGAAMLLLPVSMGLLVAQDTVLWDCINLLSMAAFYGVWILLIHTLLSAVADLLYLVACTYRAVKRVIQERNDFYKAYPFDIAGGLILGGVISMCISFVSDVLNVQAAYYIVGSIALISGIVVSIIVLMSFNDGTHARRL